MLDYLDHRICEAEKLFADNKLNEAEKIFLSIAKNGYKCDIIFNNLGVIAYRKNSIEKSLSYFNQALEVNPFFSIAIKNLFKILKIISEPYKIVPICKIYLHRYPDDKMIRRIINEATQNIKFEKNLNIFESEEYFKYNLLTNVKEISSCTNEERKHIEKTKSLIQLFSQNEDAVNKPHRNLVVTGIPKSGINTMLSILSNIDNICCFDEQIFDIKELPKKYVFYRKQVTENQERCFSKIRNYCIDQSDKFYDEDVVIGLKQNLTDLLMNRYQGKKGNDLDFLLTKYAYRTIVIVKDPVYTIASWNDDESQHLPEAMITDNNLSQKWRGISFTSQDRFERQAGVWEYYAKTILDLKNEIRIYTYEQLISCQDKVIKDTCDFLDLERPETKSLSDAIIIKPPNVKSIVMLDCTSGISIQIKISFQAYGMT